MSQVTARKIFIDEDPNQDDAATLCPDCSKRGEANKLRYMYINIDVAIYKCSGSNCMYPHTDFKYKNFADKTIYRYEIVSVDDLDGSTASSETEIDDLLSDLAPGPAALEHTPSVESASIARLESELTNLLSDHLDESAENQFDFNSLFGSPRRDTPKKNSARVKLETSPDPFSLFDTPPKKAAPPPNGRIEPLNLFDAPTPHVSPKRTVAKKPVVKVEPKIEKGKQRKLSKAYEFIRQISDKSDFKIPPTPGKSPAKKCKKHSRSRKIPPSPTSKSRVKEFSSSFLRQIEHQYSNIQTSSQYKYEVVTSDTNRSQMFVKYVKKPPDLMVGYKFKMEPD